jgi:hypothetical protein
MNQTPPVSETGGIPGGQEELAVSGFAERLVRVGAPPPTYLEQWGVWLAGLVLLVICVLAFVFLATWWHTRPSLAEVQGLLGPSGSGKEALEALETLRTENFTALRDLFQLIVLSGLVPMFTLLAGYAFGSRQRDTGS